MTSVHRPVNTGRAVCAYHEHKCVLAAAAAAAALIYSVALDGMVVDQKKYTNTHDKHTHVHTWMGDRAHR